MTVLLGGQSPLVVGSNQYQISPNVSVAQNPAPVNPSGPPTDSVLDANGNDITSMVTGGQLGGMLQLRNGLLATLNGSGTQQGQISQLAQGVADRVNTLLTSGNISDGPPAVPGIPLFTYGAASANSVAASLQVNPAITASQLAAIDPGPPEAANGIALQLASLASPTDTSDMIGGASYTQFYGNMATAVGNATSNANASLSVEQDAVTQAQNLRQQTSGVSLDQEAITVLQFQRSYDAAAKMITVLDQLTQDVVNLIPPG